MVGGGGGGGGSSTTGWAGGGGGGAYAEGTFTGVAPSTAITITVGSAGSAGNSSGSNGGGGSNSSIGSPVSITCAGGFGAIGATAAGGVTLPGSGGAITGTPNILSVPGHRGVPGFLNFAGVGASTPIGLGGEPVNRR